MSFLQLLASRITAYRKDLPQPGRPEELPRKTQNVLASYFVFDGAKFDIAKGLSSNMQITHSFALGSKIAPPSYNFSAVVVKDSSMMTGAIGSDGDGSAQLRLGLWNSTAAATKLIFQQIQSQPIFRCELEYLGSDYSLAVSAVNPNPIEGKGVFSASYLQSISPRMTIGCEIAQLRTSSRIQLNNANKNNNNTLSVETTGTIHARLILPRYNLPISSEEEVPALQPLLDPQITASLRSNGYLTASFFHPVSSKAELAAELEIAASKTMRQGVARVGAKYDFRQSCFRTMLDTDGKVSSVLELKMGPGVTFSLSGELDHPQSQSRFGIGFQLEI